MWATMVSLLPMLIQFGPVSNGVDFGSCGAPNGPSVDLRRVSLLQNRELELDSGIGRVRIVIDGQRFRLHRLASPDGELVAGDIGSVVNRSNGEETADVFVTIGLLDARPVLYWRETYQHRSFRQGLLNLDPMAMNADWNRVVTPLCEGRGGVDVSH